MNLPAWNDTQTKSTILDFVTKTADEGSPDYIPPNDRIAAFDKDGTMWVEQPRLHRWNHQRSRNHPHLTKM